MILGKVDEFQIKTSTVVYFSGEKMVVGRPADGRLHAVSAECTHLGCSVKFEEENDQGIFVCNCHKSKFDLEGFNLLGPAVTPLRQYNVAVVEGDIKLSAMGDSEVL